MTESGCMCQAIKSGRTRKLSSLWHGPYTILDKTGSVNYRIQLIGSTVSLIVHRNHLKPCYCDPDSIKIKAHKLPQQFDTCSSEKPNVSQNPSVAELCRDALVPSPSPVGGYISIGAAPSSPV